MRTSVRAIIPFDGGLILIHRVREENGQILNYYVFPGGGLEENETIEECLTRELIEEVGININIIKKLYELTSNDRKNLFYLCQYSGGEIGTGKGPEFSSIEYSNRGTYETVIISMSELENTNLLPKEIRDKWIIEYKNFSK